MKKSFAPLRHLILFTAIMLSASSLMAQSAPLDTLLNGKAFTIELQEDMGKKNKTYPDELSFMKDKLKSKYLTEKKFRSGKFTATPDRTNPNKINFEATMKNEGGELINFVGTVTGDEIEGTAEWTKKDESTRMMYTFTGERKVKKGSR